MARLVMRAVAVISAGALAGLLATVLLGFPAARAVSLPGQVLVTTTTPRPSPTSVAPPGSVVPTTAPVATTTGSTVPKTTVITVTAHAPAAPAPAAPAPAVGTPGYARTTYSPYPTGQPTTTPPPAATTTIAPLGNSLPVSPVTLPLVTKGSNAHVSPVFGILSGTGFFVALVIVAGRLLVTRAGGYDRRPLPPDEIDIGPPTAAPTGR